VDCEVLCTREPIKRLHYRPASENRKTVRRRREHVFQITGTVFCEAIDINTGNNQL
jgi:hypothetical protein